MKDRSAWDEFLDFYTKQNAGRRTRLGVFELNRDVVNDFWIEVGEMAHDVRDAIKLVVHFTSSGSEDGIDILDRENRVTLLRFEST